MTKKHAMALMKEANVKTVAEYEAKYKACAGVCSYDILPGRIVLMQQLGRMKR